MRTFIAIELPQEVRGSLSQLQNQLKTTGADVKWVEPKNIHLTLKFLGDIDDERLDKIKTILEDTVENKNTYLLRLSSIGAYPKINYPRVIWIGAEEGDNQTQEIAKILEEKISKIGIPKETRPYSSHITIGRVRSSLNRQKLVWNLCALENKLSEENLEFWVNKITLFKSTLTPKGPIYEVLKEVNLKTT